ncbi:MAG: hypothetical protein Q9170_005228 [Blastenia crenularia]
MALLTTLLSLSTHEFFSCITLLIFLYTTHLLTQRIFLRPLSKTPGSILVAATGWDEFYFDCILTGKMTYENRPPPLKIWPLRSDQSVGMEPESSGRNEVDVSFTLRCLTFDIVSDFCFPHTVQKLSQPRFAPNFNQTPHVVARLSLWQRQLGFIIPLLQTTALLPNRLVEMCAKRNYLALSDIHQDLRSQATEVVTSGGTSWAPQHHPSLFHRVVNSDLPPEEKSIKRILQEVMTLIGAGVEAPANPLAIKQELSSISNDTHTFLRYDQVQRPPYLSAVKNKGLRLGKESGRMPRINPTSQTTYQNFFFPAGTILSAPASKRRNLQERQRLPTRKMAGPSKE